MRKHGLYTLFVLVLGLLAGCGPGSFLARAQEICNKYPTPDARAECEHRYKQVQAEMQQQKAKDARKQQSPESDNSQPAGSLCFVRKSSGERVCPN